jgi:asparagine synthase (glutamine-hydrolysing)
MARVPVEQKYKNSEGKYLAREILYRHIPKTIVDKPKSGFQIPLSEWLRSDLDHLVEKYLDPSKIDDEIFDPTEILKIKAELRSGKRNNASIVWFVIMYEMWRERWFA